MSARWLLRRALLVVYTLLVVSLLVFGITQVLPADAAVTLLGENATPAALAAVRTRLGLNDPVALQYWHWLSRSAGGRFRHLHADGSGGRTGHAGGAVAFVAAGGLLDFAHAGGGGAARHPRGAAARPAGRRAGRAGLVSRRVGAGVRHRDSGACRLRRPVALVAGNRLRAADRELRSGPAPPDRPGADHFACAGGACFAHGALGNGGRAGQRLCARGRG